MPALRYARPLRGFLVRELLKIPAVLQRHLYARTLRQGIVSAWVWHNSRPHQSIFDFIPLFEMLPAPHGEHVC
jgi:hypothetical protein